MHLQQIFRIHPLHINELLLSSEDYSWRGSFSLDQDRISQCFLFQMDLLDDLGKYLANCQIKLGQTTRYLKLFEILHLELHALLTRVF